MLTAEEGGARSATHGGRGRRRGFRKSLGRLRGRHSDYLRASRGGTGAVRAPRWREIVWRQDVDGLWHAAAPVPRRGSAGASATGDGVAWGKVLDRQTWTTPPWGALPLLGRCAICRSGVRHSELGRRRAKAGDRGVFRRALCSPRRATKQLPNACCLRAAGWGPLGWGGRRRRVTSQRCQHGTYAGPREERASLPGTASRPSHTTTTSPAHPPPAPSVVPALVHHGLQGSVQACMSPLHLVPAPEARCLRLP